MKVRELVALLNKLDSNSNVLCSYEDEGVNSSSRESRIFEVVDIVESHGEVLRPRSGIPSLRFGLEPGSQKFVIVTLTSDF